MLPILTIYDEIDFARCSPLGSSSGAVTVSKPPSLMAPLQAIPRRSVYPPERTGELFVRLLWFANACRLAMSSYIISSAVQLGHIWHDIAHLWNELSRPCGEGPFHEGLAPHSSVITDGLMSHLAGLN